MRKALVNHSFETAHERGWSQLQNGALIAAAEDAGFEVFFTTDRNLKYQQNLLNRRLAIVVLQSTSWPRIQRVVPTIAYAIASASPGSYCEIEVPRAA